MRKFKEGDKVVFKEYKDVGHVLMNKSDIKLDTPYTVNCIGEYNFRKGDEPVIGLRETSTGWIPEEAVELYQENINNQWYKDAFGNYFFIESIIDNTAKGALRINNEEYYSFPFVISISDIKPIDASEVFKYIDLSTFEGRYLKFLINEIPVKKGDIIKIGERIASCWETDKFGACDIKSRLKKGEVAIMPPSYKPSEKQLTSKDLVTGEYYYAVYTNRISSTRWIFKEGHSYIIFNDDRWNFTNTPFRHDYGTEYSYRKASSDEIAELSKHIDRISVKKPIKYPAGSYLLALGDKFTSRANGKISTGKIYRITLASEACPWIVDDDNRDINIIMDNEQNMKWFATRKEAEDWSLKIPRDLDDFSVGDWVVITKSKRNWGVTMDRYDGRILKISQKRKSDFKFENFEGNDWNWVAKDGHFRKARPDEILTTYNYQSVKSPEAATYTASKPIFEKFIPKVGDIVYCEYNRYDCRDISKYVPVFEVKELIIQEGQIWARPEKGKTTGVQVTDSMRLATLGEIEQYHKKLMYTPSLAPEGLFRETKVGWSGTVYVGRPSWIDDGIIEYWSGIDCALSDEKSTSSKNEIDRTVKKVSPVRGDIKKKKAKILF